ncbi:hypothetical protein GCM10010174_85180 [Kutzneria viridogrisea]|uniref:Uncharacterized protein n=2 Tax=Kutzneria TaxID=43356 RepID=W5W725_9PSEU|nr:hypothetical protein [Kutzneria albida]AHH94014.1 hypothetical protein KALB_639 [Kutzneria albida DSM 43870]MBA8930980.1 hypothetical protein [Kutzneria viridogrisea]
MSDPISATERYKEIAGWLDEAVGRLREQDREKVAELTARLPETQRLVDEAAARERATRAGVRTHWEAVVEDLFHERWMAMTPLPRPNESVPQHELNYYDAEVGRTYEELVEAMRKRSIIPRRRGE